ncbi:MAG: hypothetical protein WCO78_02700 [Candidatus Roizmanbacteria bacterium]
MKELIVRILTSLRSSRSSSSGFSHFVRDASSSEKRRIMMKAAHGSISRQDTLLREYAQRFH